MCEKMVTRWEEHDARAMMLQNKKSSLLSRLLALGRVRVEQVRPPLGYVGHAKVQRLLVALFADGHLALRAPGDVDGSVGVAGAVNGGHGLLGPQFGLLVAVLVVRFFQLEAAEAAA